MSQKNSDKKKSELEDPCRALRKKLGRNLTFEEAMGEWDKKLQPHYEADRRAEQLTAEDYYIIQSAFRTRP